MKKKVREIQRENMTSSPAFNFLPLEFSVESSFSDLEDQDPIIISQNSISPELKEFFPDQPTFC